MQTRSESRLRTFKQTPADSFVFQRSSVQISSEPMLHYKNSVLCFHNVTNPFPRKSLILITIRIARGWGVFFFRRPTSYTSAARKSRSFIRLPPLASFFRYRLLCFRQLTASLCKKGGMGREPSVNTRTGRALCPSTARMPTSCEKSVSGCCHCLRRHRILDGGDTSVFRQQVLALLDDQHLNAVEARHFDNFVHHVLGCE
jgi:hypothetical protein